MWNSNISLVGGIFFDSITTSHTRIPLKTKTTTQDWPTTVDLGLDYDIPDEFHGWFVVATDPTQFAYCGDESSEAMDKTNWAVVSTVAEVDEVYYDERHPMNRITIDLGVERGATLVRTYSQYGHVLLLVDPSNEDTLDEYATLRGYMEESTFLDEDAYFALEEESWQAWVMTGGLQYDTRRALVELGVDEDTVDAIDEGWETIAPIAASTLDYYSGFEGSCSPAFEEAVLRVLAEGLVSLVSSR